MTVSVLTGVRQSVVRSLPTVGATGLLAVVCNLALELARVSTTGDYPWRHKTPAFLALFALGALVLWLVVALVHALVGRMWLTTTLSVMGTALVIVADYEKLRIRHEPLSPTDVMFAGDVGLLADMLAGRVLLLGAAALLLSAGLMWASTYAVRRATAPWWPRGHRPGRGVRRAVARLLTAGLCLLALAHLSEFHAPGHVVRTMYEGAGAAWKPYSQQRNYLANGFVGGFLYNLEMPGMAAPADYSATEMRRIGRVYSSAAAEINRIRSQDIGAVNVVLVLSESFSDPRDLTGITMAADPIPFTRRLMASATSGRMLAHGIGGGTANMEFEALTGMSLSQFPPQLRVPYDALVADADRFPSTVRWFRSQGHRAIAVHPFTTEMYRRSDVYRALGFDEFVHETTMSFQQRIGYDAYVSDHAAFLQLRHHLASQTRPVFLNMVTMQNHMPYDDVYERPIEVTGPDGEPLAEAGQYARGLRHTDEALRGLIGWLDRFDEPTVMVLYGDHLPGFYPDEVFEANGHRRMHETPFFVWANFDGPARAQGTTSPAHFVDLVLERAGAAVTPYYALLQKVRRHVPAMGRGLMVGSGDALVAWSRLTPQARRVLHDYRLVQYDLSVGHRYSEPTMLDSDSGPSS